MDERVYKTLEAIQRKADKYCTEVGDSVELRVINILPQDVVIRMKLGKHVGDGYYQSMIKQIIVPLV